MEVDIKQHKEYVEQLLLACSELVENPPEEQSSEFIHRGMVLALSEISKATGVVNAIDLIYKSTTEEKLRNKLGDVYNKLSEQQIKELTEGFDSICDMYMILNEDNRKFKY